MSEEKKTICFDLDGTLAQYDGWKGAEVIDDPYPDAVEFCKKLVADGWTIHVYSARKAWVVNAWLETWGFPSLMRAVNRKPTDSILVDDRAIRFKGNFKVLLEQIKIFKPWWKK